MKAILMALLMVFSFSVVGCKDDDKPKLPDTDKIEKKVEEKKTEGEKKVEEKKTEGEKKAADSK